MHFCEKLANKGSLRSQKWMNFRKTSERPLTLSYISYNLYPKTYIPQFISHNLYPTTYIPLFIFYNFKYPKTYIPQFISHNVYPTTYIKLLISHRSPLAQRIRSDLKIGEREIVSPEEEVLRSQISPVNSPFQVLLLVP